MILKGSQRGGGQDLARHLLRIDDNEHVRVHAMRGFAANDLHGAFKEVEAISRATKCQQYLFSLSLSPPADAAVPIETFEKTIDDIEDRLGLAGQPRAIVFHEKEGRRHAHCVWSRIDGDTLTARPLPFFKTKLMAVSRELYLEQGWKLPRGLETEGMRNPTNFTLAEWQQAKRQGIDPRWLKSTAQHCWNRSDSKQAFGKALGEHGLFLAKGDRRGVVVIDHAGEVYALSRLLDTKTKDVRARLGDGEGLASVSDTRAKIGAMMTPAIKRHIADSRAAFEEKSKALGQRKEAMTRSHRAARIETDTRLKEQAEQETRTRQDRLPKGFKGLWHRITGQYRIIRTLNEQEHRLMTLRHAGERQALVDRQLKERAALQAEFKALRSDQAKQLSELRKDVGRFVAMARGGQDLTPSRALTRGQSNHQANHNDQSLGLRR